MVISTPSSSPSLNFSSRMKSALPQAPWQDAPCLCRGPRHDTLASRSPRHPPPRTPGLPLFTLVNNASDRHPPCGGRVDAHQRPARVAFAKDPFLLIFDASGESRRPDLSPADRTDLYGMLARGRAGYGLKSHTVCRLHAYEAKLYEQTLLQSTKPPIHHCLFAMSPTSAAVACQGLSD